MGYFANPHRKMRLDMAEQVGVEQFELFHLIVPPQYYGERGVEQFLAQKKNLRKKKKILFRKKLCGELFRPPFPIVLPRNN